MISRWNPALNWLMRGGRFSCASGTEGAGEVEPGFGYWFGLVTGQSSAIGSHPEPQYLRIGAPQGRKTGCWPPDCRRPGNSQDRPRDSQQTGRVNPHPPRESTVFAIQLDRRCRAVVRSRRDSRTYRIGNCSCWRTAMRPAEPASRIGVGQRRIELRQSAHTAHALANRNPTSARVSHP